MDQAPPDLNLMSSGEGVLSSHYFYLQEEPVNVVKTKIVNPNFVLLSAVTLNSDLKKWRQALFIPFSSQYSEYKVTK